MEAYVVVNVLFVCDIWWFAFSEDCPKHLFFNQFRVSDQQWPLAFIIFLSIDSFFNDVCTDEELNDNFNFFLGQSLKICKFLRDEYIRVDKLLKFVREDIVDRRIALFFYLFLFKFIILKHQVVKQLAIFLSECLEILPIFAENFLHEDLVFLELTIPVAFHDVVEHW